MSRYGRVTKENRERYRVDLNFYYYHTSMCMADIARKLGIAEVTANKLLGPKPEGADTPRTQQRRYPDRLED